MSRVYNNTDLHEPVDIADALQTVCELLQLEPHNVARLTIEPTEAEAIVYTTNENGQKYLTETNGIAAEVRRIRVRT